jgi:hypothetical protein
MELLVFEKGLNYKRVVLDYPGKTRLSSSIIRLSNFHRYNPLDRTYPFSISLIPHLSSLKNNHEGDARTSIGDFLVPPWNLGVLG